VKKIESMINNDNNYNRKIKRSNRLGLSGKLKPNKNFFMIMKKIANDNNMSNSICKSSLEFSGIKNTKTKEENDTNNNINIQHNSSKIYDKKNKNNNFINGINNCIKTPEENKNYIDDNNRPNSNIYISQKN
jgi:hypothetical protein